MISPHCLSASVRGRRPDSPLRRIHALRVWIVALVALLAAGTMAWAQSPAVIVIDPGHGGDDYGVRAPGGSLEKDINMMLALDLKRVLEESPDIRVILTREDDRRVTLKERGIVVNSAGADLLVSLHCAYAHQAGVDSFLVYFYQPDSRENGEFHELKRNMDGREVKMLPWDLAQLPAVPDSRDLAGILQIKLNAFFQRYSGTPIGEQLFLLGTVACPAILLESCTLTNPEAEKRMLSAAYREEYCRRIRDAVQEFLRGRTRLTRREGS